VRKTGFTIAPEAGTQRMRDVINKNITEQDVMNSCSVAFEEGWSAMKMYFMIGLPTETDEDVKGIAELCRKVRELGRNKYKKNVKATCSASYFVPKPHTPFQWCQQEDLDSIKRKQRMLKELGRRYRIDVKVHHAETSVLEGIISRGDRNLCGVIERAWRIGCRFDGWTEHFDFGKWMKAFEIEGIAIEPYLKEFPVREFDKPGAPLVQLPWDHIDTLVKREFNAREYTKGIKAKISPPCELPVKIIDGRPTAIAPSSEEFERVASQPLLCYACGLECDLTKSREHLNEAYAMHEEVRTYEARIASVKDTIEQPLVQLQGLDPTPNSQPPAPVFRYRATFEKGEEVKYLSHLDLTRALPRAFRRAKIKLGYSAGYHPMPLIQYGPALGVGTAGYNELIDFNSPDELEAAQFLERINAVLPAGLRFKSLRQLTAGSLSLIKEVNRAEYRVRLDAPEIEAAVRRMLSEQASFDASDGSQIHRRAAEAFMTRGSCVIERVRRDKRQQVDVRRYTKKLSLVDDSSLCIVTEVSPNGGVKPIEVMAAVYGLTQTEMTSLSSRVRRLRLYSEEQTGDAGNMPGIAAALMSEQGDELRVAGSHS
jgi:radical SAM-linked protein